MAFLVSSREFGNILRIGLPIFVAQLSQIGMNFVDTIMAGRYAARDLAGVAIAGSLWAPITLFAVGCLLALPGMSAQLVGARKPERSAHLLRQGIFLALFMSAVLISILYLISENLHLLGIDKELAPVTSGYLKAMLFGLPGFLLFITVRSFFEGFGRTRPAMVIGIVCLLINIPCNYVFIYGHMGMPEMGGVGCGVATAICYWCMFLSIFFFLHRDKTLRKYSFFGKDRVVIEGRRLDLPLIATVVRIGFPNAVALCIEVSSFALTALLLAPLGTTVVAGHQIGRKIGFPTANIAVNDLKKIIPANGAYAVRAKTSNGEYHNGMVNIGKRPTVHSDGNICIEAHLFDFSGDLYGQSIEIEFIDRLRPEQKMNGLEELTAQLKKDKEHATNILLNYPTRI